jgi:FixJ family two-component response regulator
MYTYLTTFPHVNPRSPSLSPDLPVVFIVDADVSTRVTLEFLVRSAGWQPETFSSAREFLSHPRALVPNCLVLDINLPDLSGLELQKRISAERIDMPFIFVTGHGDVPMTVTAMKAGAAEFLTKPCGDDVLLAAIEQALERSRTALARDSEMRGLRDRCASLSRREQEVMALVVCGLLNKQVGFELGISEITVKAHRGQVMRKMQARSLPHLVNMAAHLGITQEFQAPLALAS